MERFWIWVDKAWLGLASVRLTLVIFIALLLLSIPGTVILQHNISNVDPAMQYSYEFWKFADSFQLFTSYHSFWYVGLIALLAVNLIACSIERWPQMWKLASAKPVALSEQALTKSGKKRFVLSWKTKWGQEDFQKKVEKYLEKKWKSPVLVRKESSEIQIFWQTHRWSRVANYLVHTSLLVVFLGAIVTALFGFEGGANIPEGQAVDTFLLFKEGKYSSLKKIPGTLPNERLMPMRAEVEYFNVEFYEKFKGRPKDFRSKLNLLSRRNGEVLASKIITVNDPLEYCWRKRFGICTGEFVFYQASYGALGDFDLRLRIIDRNNTQKQSFYKVALNEAVFIEDYKKTIMPIRALENVQGLGPGMQLQELRGDELVGEPFWILKDYPAFDFEKRDSKWVVVADEINPRYFTGLQIGFDPGAPIYWLGCLGMLIGTFYALFVQHKKYHLRLKDGTVVLSASIHRLPLGFEKQVQDLAKNLQNELGEATHDSV